MLPWAHPSPQPIRVQYIAPHMDGAIVFATWRQRVHPRLIHASLGPPESTTQTASVGKYGALFSVFTYWHVDRFSCFCTVSLYFTMGRPISSSTLPLLMGDLDPHLIHGPLGPSSTLPLLMEDLDPHLIHGSLGPSSTLPLLMGDLDPI